MEKKKKGRKKKQQQKCPLSNRSSGKLERLNKIFTMTLLFDKNSQTMTSFHSSNVKHPFHCGQGGMQEQRETLNRSL